MLKVIHAGNAMPMSLPVDPTSEFEPGMFAQLGLIGNDIIATVSDGTAPIGKAEFVEYLIAWQDTMEDVVYTPTNYLPGVNAETGELDGSVRSYGTWTGVHSESGKSWELSSYHTWDFQDGLVINGGDYFDAGGFLASLSSE